MSHSQQLKADLLLTAPAHGEPTYFLRNCFMEAVTEVMAVIDFLQTVTKEVMRQEEGGRKRGPRRREPE